MHQHTAQGLASLGRGDDSMLVHMTPREVGGLQALAMAHGGSLTTNPQTGLPEAGFLDNLLPTIAGIGLSMVPGIGAPLAAGLVGGFTALQSGDLGKGLMAGLSAFGGAGLGEAAAGLGAEVGGAGLDTVLPPEARLYGAGINDQIVETGTLGTDSLTKIPSVQGAGANLLEQGAGPNPLAGTPSFQRSTMGLGDISNRAGNMLEGAKAAFDQPSAFYDKYSQALGGPKGVMAAAVPTVVGLGGSLFGSSGTSTPTTVSGPSNYTGPYRPTIRAAQFNRNPLSTQEYQYFTDVNPYPGYISAASGGLMALGGAISPNDNAMYPMSNLAAGKAGFNVQSSPTANEVVGGYDARINPFTGAQMMAAGGIATLPEYNAGGRFLQGPGDGTSDSIRANIEGKQEARLADGEFVVDARTVSELGNGSSKAGARKLYAMMDRVHGARKQAKRGEDTKAARFLPG